MFDLLDLLDLLDMLDMLWATWAVLRRRRRRVMNIFDAEEYTVCTSLVGIPTVPGVHVFFYLFALAHFLFLAFLLTSLELELKKPQEFLGNFLGRNITGFRK